MLLADLLTILELFPRLPSLLIVSVENVLSHDKYGGIGNRSVVTYYLLLIGREWLIVSASLGDLTHIFIEEFLCVPKLLRQTLNT